MQIETNVCMKLGISSFLFQCEKQFILYVNISIIHHSWCLH